uniref:Uncharacterized protein n=1 Tax=Dromaius novaehollandiae TaxID=8790 RepID=A0A8C4K1F2_DRONO
MAAHVHCLFVGPTSSSFCLNPSRLKKLVCSSPSLCQRHFPDSGGKGPDATVRAEVPRDPGGELVEHLRTLALLCLSNSHLENEVMENPVKIPLSLIHGLTVRPTLCRGDCIGKMAQSHLDTKDELSLDFFAG